MQYWYWYYTAMALDWNGRVTFLSLKDSRCNALREFRRRLVAEYVDRGISRGNHTAGCAGKVIANTCGYPCASVSVCCGIKRKVHPVLVLLGPKNGLWGMGGRGSCT